MDIKNRVDTPCKSMFVVNPKILRPSGAEILACARFAKCVDAKIISAPGGRRILGFNSFFRILACPGDLQQLNSLN